MNYHALLIISMLLNIVVLMCLFSSDVAKWIHKDLLDWKQNKTNK